MASAISGSTWKTRQASARPPRIGSWGRANDSARVALARRPGGAARGVGGGEYRVHAGGDRGSVLRRGAQLLREGSPLGPDDGPGAAEPRTGLDGRRRAQPR